MTDYSVIIPAYNEERWLPRSLQALKSAMAMIDLRGEIIVTDNNSTDKTAEVARNHGARVVFESKNQISRSRNAGARVAKGTYLVFLDADTLISSALLKKAITNLESGTCCGGGTLILFDHSTGRCSNALLHFWRAVSKRFQLAAGSFVYCLRCAFEEVGGFSELLYAGEEIRLSVELKKWGKKRHQSFQIITDHSVITSARKLDHPIRVILATFICIVLPFSVYSKTLCWYWYKRD